AQARARRRPSLLSNATALRKANRDRRCRSPAGARPSPGTRRVFMSTTCLITGATGLVGSHLAEACAARGLGVRALVRPGSNASLLERVGAEVVRGDLADDASLRRAVEGADYVFHCAAKVGDWGPVEEYRKVNVH